MIMIEKDIQEKAYKKFPEEMIMEFEHDRQVRYLIHKKGYIEGRIEEREFMLKFMKWKDKYVKLGKYNKSLGCYVGYIVSYKAWKDKVNNVFVELDEKLIEIYDNSVHN